MGYKVCALEMLTLAAKAKRLVNGMSATMRYDRWL